MSLEQQIREALLQLASTLQQDIMARANTVATELAAAAERDRMGALAEETSEFEARIAKTRAEGEKRVESECARVRAEAEQAAASELGRLRAELDGLREQIEARRADAERAEAHAQALRADAGRAQEQFETTAAELALLRDQVVAAEEALVDAQSAAETARVAERQDEMAQLDRLAAGVRRIGEGLALTDVLTALAESAAGETARTAVFVSSRDAFQPYRVHGFNTDVPRALSRSEAASLTGGLPFAPLPAERVGFSVPIEVGGQTVALVYADDGASTETPVPSVWPEAIEILARHAALRLETLTALRTVQALGAPQNTASPVATVGVASPSTTADDQSARRYARLLVSEIKLYNEGAVRLGRQNRDLLDRLRPEIERARRLYEERVPGNVPARATYFDDELVQTLADGDPGLLGST